MNSCLNKKQRSTRQTIEQTHSKLAEIKYEVLNHIGQPAILLIKEGRSMVPHFVTLEGSSHGVYGSVKCFSPDGEFRQYLKHSVNTTRLLTGEQQLIYFDEI